MFAALRCKACFPISRMTLGKCRPLRSFPNRKLSRPFTGDEKIDSMNNPTKRVFGDPVGRRCGDREQPLLLQTCRRDAGGSFADRDARGDGSQIDSVAPCQR